MSTKKRNIRLSKILSYAGCAREPPVAEDFSGKEGFSRRVFCNEPDRHSAAPFNYTLNYISTTKYNFLTFIPKGLYEQFRRAANLYFLMNAIVSLTPISPYQAASLILPLVFVVGLSMFKEALEDWRRWLADQEVNQRPVLTHDGKGEFHNKEWQKLRVGDVVKVEKDHFFPADLLLLSSSYPDGVCYVETMNLDGETNLKLRKADERTLELNNESVFENFQAHIECEDPNPNLYMFIGNLDWNGERTSISPQQILLRDSKLRNTSHVYGVVIFTGHDTKVMQNALPPPSKRSRIEKRMDKIIYILFSILVTICTTGSIVFGVRTHDQMPKWWYLRPDSTTVYYDPSRAAQAAILQAITSLTLYTYLIPISLYVSIEIVKVLQALFISNDLKMYFEDTDIPARARTSNLNEELGQVDTILSDKTGTLTCNQMEFLKCTVAGVAYGRGVTEVEKATAKRLGKMLSELDDSIGDNPDDYDGEERSTKEHIKGFAFKDERLMEGRWIYEKDPDTIRMFMRILSVCHTAIPDEDEATGKITYEAESPDEASFVVAAKQFGFEFFQRTQTSVRVRETDPMSPSIVTTREYKILNLIEFNSTRKRMSVIVEDEEGRIILMCKGADSVIFERLNSTGNEYLEQTKVHLKKYGEAGLRTLALSYAILDRGFYEKWNQEYLNAKSVLSNNREALLDTCAENIEKNLILVGATAVEDKLQNGVPETIDHLAQAGLKIWVLTGDKLETAINIGYACSLLRQGMEQIIVSLDTPEYSMVESTGDKERLKEYCFSKVQEQILEGAKIVEANKDEDTVFAFIIDGKSLIYALDDSLKSILLGLAMQCASVICCRVSPKQKALITRLVKDGTGKVTLGIGDGANDVGMIQEADIGIGISGVEGQQAVMASDFSIAQFRFLDRLLTVHGHWCYKRIASMITYFFFKNLAFGFTLFFFNAYTVFSGQVIYNDWHASLFNVFFTSLPVIALGVFEQDVSADTCQKFPILYQQGPRNLFFSWGRIFSWMINGIYIAIVSFWLIIYIFDVQAFEKSGRLPELAGFGVTLYTCIIWSVNLQLALTIDYYTWITHLFIWGSIALWYIFVVVYGYMSPSFTTNGYKIFTEVMGPSPIYWLCTLLLTIVALLPILVYKSMQWKFVPMDHQIIQEIKYLKKDESHSEFMKQESKRAVLKSQIGFTAAVNAVVKRMVKKGKLPKSAKKSANDLARLVDGSN